MSASSAHRSLKEKQRDERERLILEVAEEVFLEKGFYEASVDEIAARVGVAKGTIYLHFPSKEDIAISIFMKQWEKLLQCMHDTLQGARSPREKLERFVLLCCESFSARRRAWATFMGRQEMGHFLAEKKGEQMRAIWKKVSDWVLDVFEEGKREGMITKTIPTDLLLRTFMGLVSSVGKHRLGEEDFIDYPPDEIAAYLTKIFFDGVSLKSDEVES